MSGLFGARSPSPLFNILAGKRKSTAPKNPGQGEAFTPGQATPMSKPVKTPRAKAKAIKNGESTKLRVPYG